MEVQYLLSNDSATHVSTANWKYDKSNDELLFTNVDIPEDSPIKGTIPFDSNYGEDYDMKLISNSEGEI